MKAYSQGISKVEFVMETKKHAKLDEFIKGSYWNPDKGKGCAVGCAVQTINKIKGLGIPSSSFNQHPLMETHLGIPKFLALVEDTIFEGLSTKRSKLWPVQFASAIKSGSDLESIKVPFLIVILKSSLASMSKVKFNKKANPEVAAALSASKAAIAQTIKALRSGSPEELRLAREAAYSAAYSAAYAANSAAYSAANSAYSAANSAAYSAAYSAASSAARSAANSAREKATEKTYAYLADELLKLIKKAK